MRGKNLEAKKKFSLHCDGLGVLQDGVGRGHLHGDSVHALPGEGVGDAAIQRYNGLQRKREGRGKEMRKD